MLFHWNMQQEVQGLFKHYRVPLSLFSILNLHHLLFYFSSPSGYTFPFSSVITFKNSVPFFSNMTNQTSLFEIVHCEEFDDTAPVRGITLGLLVELFHVQNDHAAGIRTATMSEAGPPSECEEIRCMHNHVLPRQPSTDIVVNITVVAADSAKKLLYAYTFYTTNAVPATLDDSFSSRIRAQGNQAMQPLFTSSRSSQGHHGDNPSSEDAIIDVQHPAMQLNSGRTSWLEVSISTSTPLNKSGYLLTTLADTQHLLRNVYVTHFSSVVQLFYVHQFEFYRGMISVTFSFLLNSNRATGARGSKICWSSNPRATSSPSSYFYAPE